MTITHLNPESMHANPAFSQAVVAEGVKKLVFVGGQNAVDASGNIVGKDLKTQTAQALKNVLTVLAAAGASQKDVTRLGIYVQAGLDIREGFAASQEVWGRHATAITVLQVAALGRPEFLVEIEATAAL
ncbi:MAG TPA: RidA family protein [Polyangiaceae bacterium]